MKHEPAKTFTPAIDKANTTPGSRKNINTRYTMANHLYTAVVLPRNFAIPMGTFLMAGMGYHNNMPNMLKNKWARATWDNYGRYLIYEMIRFILYYGGLVFNICIQL